LPVAFLCRDAFIAARLGLLQRELRRARLLNGFVKLARPLLRSRAEGDERRKNKH
jgi:hypothetical protein